MKSFLWAVGGLCAAAIGIIILAPRRTQPIDLLAHSLEQAWADNHTVV